MVAVIRGSLDSAAPDIRPLARRSALLKAQLLGPDRDQHLLTWIEACVRGCAAAYPLHAAPHREQGRIGLRDLGRKHIDRSDELTDELAARALVDLDWTAYLLDAALVH